MLGIVATCQLRQRQRAFGQRFEDQRGRSARGNQRAHHGQGGVGAVTGESGAGADQQGTVMAFPKRKDGEPILGSHLTNKRMIWINLSNCR
jgi:hypothetical protein